MQDHHPTTLETETRNRTSRLIHRQVTSQVEFGLPSSPWMAYTLAQEMIQSFATVWYPSSNLYSPLVLVVTIVSVAVCFVATRPQVRLVPIGEALMLFGAPMLFIVVFFCAGGGPFPIRRGFPNASDFLATNIALGAGYLLAREATRLPTRWIRLAGWIEVIGFAMLAAYEILLHSPEFFRR